MVQDGENMNVNVCPEYVVIPQMHCKAKQGKQQNTPQIYALGFCVNKNTVFSVMQYKTGVNPLILKKTHEVAI